MINRYSQTATSRLSPTVLPLPFEEIMQAGAIKQRAYDENEQQEYKLQSIIQNLKADPKAEFAKSIVDQKYNSRLLELSTRVADKGDVDFKKAINQISAEYNNDPLVQTINQRRVNYEAYQQDAIKNKDKYVDFYDPYKNEGDIQGNYQETGALRKFNYTGMDQRQDYSKKAEELVKGIADSGSLKDVYVRDKNGEIEYDSLGQRRKVKRGFEGVARIRIGQVAAANAEPFLKTQEGRFFMHELVGRGGFEYDNLNESQKKGFQKEATNYLAKLAEKQIGGKSIFGEDIESLSKDQMDLQDIAAMSTVETGAVKLGDIQDLNQYKVDIPLTNSEKSVLQAEATLAGGLTRGAGDAFGLSEPTRQRIEKLSKASGDKEVKISLTPQQQLIFDKASKYYGRAESTDRGKAELINKYLDDAKDENVNISVNEFPVKRTEEENRRLFGTDNKGASAIVNRSIKLIDGDGPKVGNGSEIFANFGDPKKFNINVTGELTPDNPYFPSGRQVTVTGINGQVVAKYAISGTKQEDAVNGVKAEFYKARYKPEGRHPFIARDAEGNPTGEYFIDYEKITDPKKLDSNNKPIKIGEIARLLDKDGKVLVETKDEFNALDKLYRKVE